MPIRYLLAALMLLPAGACTRLLHPVAQTDAVPQGVGPDPVEARPAAPTRRGAAADAVDPQEALRQSAADRQRWSKERPAE
ncbi:hypothetical protein [Methylobacterium dankookense]|uniref:Uncharacterized protein n=1 Tax=Methylobacterium dankookense TaxID=560405 RepID=A0A564G7Z1_9HYPH|nr:hypothetical protein [Methylobacterium dankookense]GJD57015.1 hypothetical protein IFDJLNFL_2915 [Methylobacterium dankookense]VUF16136.1 hypothetical protein MTDSW087_05893 [Methylobacterium dankookense]